MSKLYDAVDRHKKERRERGGTLRARGELFGTSSVCWRLRAVKFTEPFTTGVSCGPCGPCEP